MDAGIDRVFRDALELPDESKLSLAKKPIAHVEANIDPELQREHLETVRRRREELLSGVVEAVDGPEAIRRGHLALSRRCSVPITHVGFERIS